MLLFIDSKQDANLHTMSKAGYYSRVYLQSPGTREKLQVVFSRFLACFPGSFRAIFRILGQIFGEVFGQGCDQALGEGKNNKYSVQYYPA